MAEQQYQDDGWQLDFESKPNRIRGGGIFRPQQDAVARWVIPLKPSYRILGPEFQVLYKTKGDEYLLAHYVDCKQDVRNGQEVWWSDGPPQIDRLEPIQAARFLFHYNQDVPDDLIRTWEREENRREEVIVRPLSYWCENKPAGRLLATHTHEVDVLDAVEEIASLLAMFLQEKSQWSDSVPHAEFLAARLFAIYRVDIRVWMEDHVTPPPDSVPLLDLDWPEDLENAKETIRELQQLLMAPLSCEGHGLASLNSDLNPTDDEKALARAALREAEPQLDQLYGQLVKKCRQARELRESERRKEVPHKVDAATTETDETEPSVSSEANMISEPVPNSPVDQDIAPGDRPLPTLELEPGGFRYNGVFFELTSRPWELLSLFLTQRYHKVTRRDALDRIWGDKGVGPENVDTALSNLHTKLREAMFLTKHARVIHRLASGDNAAWQLAFRFELVKHDNKTDS